MDQIRRFSTSVVKTATERLNADMDGLRQSRKVRRSVVAWLFLIPALTVLALYRFIPLLWNIVLSFQDLSYTGETEFVGLTNFYRLIEDPVVLTSIFNTLFFLLSVPIAVTIALFLALLLNKKIPGRNIFRSMIFLPYIMMMVAVAVIWAYMFNTDNGVLNYALSAIGIIDNPIPWLTHPWWARVSIILTHVWKTTGFYLIIILSGLQTIPLEVYSAARVDGASRYQQFRYITLPLLKPTLGVCALVGLITSFELFDLVFMLTDGGPGRSTEILITWIYRHAFQFGNYGYGALLAIFLFLTMFTLAILTSKVISEGYYDYEK